MSMMRFIIFICCIIALDLAEASLSCPQPFCLAVVDAGSTGSRLHIYAFDKDNLGKPINIHELESKKIKPGLSSIAPEKEKLDKYLNELMQVIPDYRLPVYLYATAGMRLETQGKQEETYKLIEAWFSTQSSFELLEAKTISGEDEALYAWLAVNQQNDQGPVGVIDIGGASTQVAFPVNDKTLITKNDLRQVNHQGKTIQLFVKSFLELGQTEILKKIGDNPICFAKDYILPSGIQGEGDALQCEEALLKVIEPFQVSNQVRPILEKNTIQAWYTIGAPAMTIKSQTFSPFFKEGSFSTYGFKEYVDSAFCQNHWTTIKDSYPKDTYASGYCLYASYYHALLSESYGINQDQKIKTLPQGKGEDWTYGVLFKNQIIDGKVS